MKFYELGMDKTRNRASADVFFNMAEAYRLTGNKEDAIKRYKLSALDATETGAYSSYYLGKLYVETGNKPLSKFFCHLLEDLNFLTGFELSSHMSPLP